MSSPARRAAHEYSLATSRQVGCGLQHVWYRTSWRWESYFALIHKVARRAALRKPDVGGCGPDSRLSKGFRTPCVLRLRFYETILIYSYELRDFPYVRAFVLSSLRRGSSQRAVSSHPPQDKADAAHRIYTQAMRAIWRGLLSRIC